MFYKSLLLLYYFLVLKISVCANVFQNHILLHYSQGSIEFEKYPADRNPCQYKIIIHQ